MWDHHHRTFCGKCLNEAISTKAHVFCQRTILYRNQFYKLKYYKSKVVTADYKYVFQVKILWGKKSPPATKSSHPEVFLQNFCKFTGKPLCQNIQSSASKTSGGCFLATDDFLDLNDFSGAHLGGWSIGSGPLPFLKQSKLSPKFLNQFRRNALKNRFKKQ